LLELGAELESRDLDKERLSEAEIEALIGERDYKEFLNTRNDLYRTRRMEDHGEEPQSDSQTCGASRITNGAWL
jgi:arsenate reductase-like glutaredoxin family protein